MAVQVHACGPLPEQLLAAQVRKVMEEKKFARAGSLQPAAVALYLSSLVQLGWSTGPGIPPECFTADKICST